MSIAPEIEELTSQLSSTDRGLVFDASALESCRHALAALDASALASRMTDLLAVAMKLVGDDPQRGELAARQLCELCALVQGRAKSASDLFGELAVARDRTAQLTGRAPSQPRAPPLDARAPTGTVKLASIAPPIKPRRAR